MDRRRFLVAASASSLAAPSVLRAQSLPKITIGMSGWTGFAPLTLAEQAGLFRNAGIEVETRFVPQRERHLALAAGALNCVVTTVDTMITWAGAGVALTQVLQLDRSKGGDGIAVRPGINSFADLKGKQVAVDGAGTTPYFVLAYMARRNGVSVREIQTPTLAPQPAAQAFVAGQFDGCSTYEPYLSQVRAMGADKGKILATTVDYPCVIDTMAFQPAFIRANPEAVRRVIAGWFAAVDMIAAEPDRAFEIMGRRTNQTGEQFKASQSFIHWPGRAENLAFFRGHMQAGLPAFMTEAATVLREAGVIRNVPDLNALVTAEFLS
jgi:NitT/TauT family transport system substrate-binding protein